MKKRKYIKELYLFLFFPVLFILFFSCTQPEETDETFTHPEEIPQTNVLAVSAIRGDGELSVGWTVKDGVEYEVWYSGNNNPENAVKWNGEITITLPVAGTVISGLENSTQYYIWIKIKNENDFEAAINETPQAPPSAIHENFAYVPGGTVTGSHNYSMKITVPENPSGYMNAGKTLVKRGVFVEGRKITIEPFFMTEHETTRQLWHEVQSWAEANGYYFQNKINAPDETVKNLPVSNINWRDAVVWCNAYSEMNGLEPVYYYQGNALRDSRDSNGTACDNADMNKTKNGYKLPTEAEREYAARGGDPGKADWMFLFSGSNNADAVAWYHGNSANTIKNAGTKNANRLGIYDLSGNVQEWGWDWMNFNVSVTPDTPAAGEAYGGRFTQKSMSGGGVGSNVTMSCAADRWSFVTEHSDAYIGFRVTRSAE